MLCLFFIVSFGQTEGLQGASIVQVNFSTELARTSFYNVLPIDTLDIFSNKNNETLEILLRPGQLSTLWSLCLSEPNIQVTVIVPDLSNQVSKEFKEMLEQEERIQKLLQEKKIFKTYSDFLLSDEFFRGYHNYSVILDFVKELQRKYPSLISPAIAIGESVEGRTIQLFKIQVPQDNNDKRNGKAQRISLWINSLQHAREWVSAPTTQYIIWKLLEGYTEGNPEIRRLLSMIDIHYVPVLNVDGFLYTHSNNRMWRKNRRGGYGVDLNRNWKAGWGSGSSTNRNSEVFRGESPMSEPECQAVDKYIRDNPSIRYGIDFHSFSEVLLRPWGKQSTVTPDETFLRDFGQSVVNAVNQVFARRYKNWRAAQLGIGNGLDDQMYEEYKMISGFTMELRPSSSFGGGFHLPPDQILDCGKENLAGVLKLMNLMVLHSQ